MSIYPPQTTAQGSIFNPDIWVAGDSTTIDADYLNENYLKYPVAQGYETLTGATNLGDLNMSNNDITNLGSITSDTSLTGQITFTQPPHSVDPITGEDLTTKAYVDSLVGQYSGGFNLFLNYSETITVDSISYKKLSASVSSATQQSITTTTNGSNQLIASFISDQVNITEIPTGLWSLFLYGGISATGGVVYYYFKIRKNSGGVLSDIATSGNSIDINATPSTNPDVYHMNATIPSAVSVLLTDRIIIEIYCIKISGVNVDLTTYFESSYYSYIQTTLNAGTTLLSSNNNWLGSNVFNGNLSVKSTLTDSNGGVGLAGQVLSSTGLGTDWVYSGSNAYIAYTLAELPFDLPTTTYSNLYLIFSGNVGSGRILTIPIVGFTIGTLLTIKNLALGTVNLSSTFLLFTVSTTSTSLYPISGNRMASFFFNGSSWVQTTVLDKLNDLSVSGTLTAGNISFNGAFTTDIISQTATANPVQLYSGTSTSSIYLGGGNTSSPQHTTGPIIIGSDSSATGGINIGTGTDTATPATNTINIGSGTYGTIIKGTLTGDYGFSSASGNITTGGTGTISATGTGGISTASGNISSSSGNITTAGAGTISTTGTGGISTVSGDISSSSGNITTAGTGSISTTGSGSISTPSGSISSNGTITGTSIVSANFGPANNAADVSICGNSTGDINIGTATRTTSNKNINIGNGINSTNQINIGVSGNTTAIQGTLNVGTTSAGKEINMGTTTSTTTFNGLVKTNTNTRYLNSTTTGTIVEYLSGGLSNITHNAAGDFNLGTTRLNSVLDVIFTSNQVQTFTFPSAPEIGQTINIRCGKNGGSITLPAVGSNLFYTSNLNLAAASGSASIVLPNISTSSWMYYESTKWVQMNDSLYPLVDTGAGTTALSIGSTVVNGNISIGGSLSQGDVSIGTAQTSGGIVSIGSLAGGITLNSNTTIGSNKTIFTTSAQQMRLGYPTTVATTTTTATLGPFFKSFGPVSMPGSAYDILYEGADGIFTATGGDGCGGLLIINIKNTDAKYATYVYSMAKRSGLTGFQALSTISLNTGGWTGGLTPSLSQPSTGGNNIRVSFNGTDWSGATLSWMFMGSG